MGKMSDYQLHSSHHSFCLHDGTGAIDVSRFDNDVTEAPDAWEAVPVSFIGGGCVQGLPLPCSTTQLWWAQGIISDTAPPSSCLCRQAQADP